ncbi:MAG: carbohydrate ABC transporter substrate-binding protein [Clostridiaceae bacterium]|nr:carbohydrate ABC transporter substrate-binding protein [Clostridiaceae bacterium]
MKNWKKLISLILVLVLAFSLVACGGSDEPETADEPAAEEPAEEPAADEADEEEADTDEEAEEEPAAEGDFAGKTLRVYGLDGGYGTKGWLDVIAAFEEATGATVEAKFEKNIYDVARPEIQAGSPPDVLYNSLGQEGALTETMIKEDMLLDLTDVFESEVFGEDIILKDKLIAGAVDTSLTNPYGDGKTYLAPLFYSPTGLWYNKALFTEGGGDYELPTTMDEFIALGEQAAEDDIALFTYPTTGYFDTFSFALMHEVGGTELFDKLMNFDPDAWANEATPIFETIGSILEYVEPNTVSQANNELFTNNQLAVMQNKALFMPNGTWIIGEMADAKAADGFEWGFMALPAMEDGGDRYAFSWLEQAFIPADAAEPELAKAFISYLYSDEAVELFVNNTIVNEEGEEVPSPAVQPVLGVEEFITDEDNKLFYSIYNDGVKAAMGGFAAAPAVEGVDFQAELFDSINSVASGEETVEEWQASVVDAATKISEAME